MRAQGGRDDTDYAPHTHGRSRASGSVPVLGIVGLAILAMTASSALLLRGPEGTSVAASPPVLQSWDTVAVFGPETFATPTGATTTFVESVPLTIDPEGRYELRIEKGDSTGAYQPTVHDIFFNGHHVVADALPDFVSYRIVEPSDTNTIRVDVGGDAGDFVKVALLVQPSPSFTVFGPATFIKQSAGLEFFPIDTFPLPAAAKPPYRIHVINGDPDGTLKVDSARVAVDEMNLLNKNNFNANVGSFVREFSSLDSLNLVYTRLIGPANRRITYRILATDSTAPELTVNTPADSITVGIDSVLVSGTVVDETVVRLAIDGNDVTIGSGGSFSAYAHLSEGGNDISIVATNGAGLVTTVSRHVTVDTQTPVLAVTAPVDGLITNQASVAASGTVSDLSIASVTANGVPLTLVGTSFSGNVSLSHGLNIITFTATDTVGNNSAVILQVTQDTVPPVLTVTAPTDGDSTAVESITVAGTVSDGTSVSVTANLAQLTVTGDTAFSGNITVAEGTNPVIVRATDAAGNVTADTLSITFTGASLPPDPATVAPALDPTVATTVFAATEFLYTGPDSIQRGVAPGTIELRRAAAIRGKVLDRSGNPISGVRVEIHDRPEFGYTRTRTDGDWDLAINGGGSLTVQFTKQGWLTAHRTVNPAWQEWHELPEVHLVALDTVSTAIDMTEQVAMQIAQNSVTQDADGSRQVTLMFKPGTVAEAVYADGSTDTLTTLTVRATEYTVGSAGPSAMPADLPATSGYTYAVELSADEAIALGASGVAFSQPVSLYVSNFLAFDAGTPVPSAFYDRDAGHWAGIPDGLVLKIVGSSGGEAEIDIDGDDVAESTTTLDSLGIAAGERAQLDTAFATGTALWRLSTDHFSPLDLNYPVVLGGPAPEVNIRDRSDCSTIRNHSIIECENQLLGEIIPLVGTEFALTYRSSRSPGWTDGYAFTMELISDSIPDLLGIVLSVTVAGRTFVDSFPSTPNQQHTYAWDGRDAFGRPVQGRQPALIKLEYRYPQYYSIPAATAASFGLTCQGTTGQGMSACIIPQTLSSAGRSEGRRIAAEAGVLGTWDARDAGVGGWSLTAHHTYNPAASVLQFGDGSMRSAPPAQPLIVNFAGAVDGYSGDGGPAVDAGLSDPTGLAVADDGSVYIADSGNHRIRRVSPDGIISTVAGTGTAGFGGDGGSATQAMLDTPWGVAVAPDGSIYIGDDNHRIRRVDSLGVITTIAGTGTYGFSGDGGPAIDANLKFPRLLKFAPDGTLYFADGGIFDTHRLRKIDPSGLISTVMPTSYCDVFSENCGDGIPAYQAGFYQLLGLDVGDDGSVYLADGNFLIRRIKPDGEIETIAGVPGQFIHTPSGISADSASIDVPEGILARRDGSVVFGELGSIGGLRGIDQRGFLVDVAGNGDSSCPAATQPGCGDGEIATSAYVTGDHWDIVEGPDGTIYFNNALGAAGAGRVRRLLPWLPQLDTASHSAASEDGSELYLFSSDGRHLETRSTLTGSLLYLFGYDAAGRLTSVEDADSLVTTIERDTNGQPTAIVSPYGQRTELDVDSASYLVQLRTPASDTVQLAYSTGGQLISLTDPNGNEKTYTYDSFGRLVADEDELGGSIDLTPTFSLSGVSVALETTLGRTGTYLLETRTDGAERRVQTAPDGTVAERITTVRDSTWSLSPDSTVTTVTRRADPRFGPQARYPTSASVRLPSSLQLSLTAGRQATLSDSTNPLSLLTLLDSVIVNGRKYTSSYAQSTRTYTHTTPTGRMTVERLDSLGRIVSDSVAGLLPWTYTWDSNGRLSQAQQGSRVFEYAYDNLGRLETVTDPLDQVTEFEYDAAGRLTRQVLPDTNEIAFGWDRNGNLTSLTPPGRPAHTFTYDAVNQMASYAAPDLGSGSSTTEYTFDLDRQLTSILRPDSTEIMMAYDSAGRIATVTIPRGSYDYSYSPTTGQLTGISSPDSVALAYTYDGALVTGVEWSGQVNGTVDVTHDDDFRVVKQRVNGTDSVAYQYDNDGLMTAAGALTMTQNSANGLLTGTTLGSVTTSQTYDAFGGLASYTASYSGNTLFQTTYTRDAVGRITRLIETIQGATDTLDYAYDLVGRLTSVDRNGVMVESYTYDANGNRTSFAGPSGTVNATYDDQDRLLTYGNATFSYTAAGELTRKVVGADTTDYTYDEMGNLVGVALQAGTDVEYLIDGQDRRVGRKVGGQILDGLLYGDQLNPVARLDSLGNPAAHFVYGSRPNVPDYMVQAGTTYRLITDHLGSVRLIVNAGTGQVAQRLDYTSFGTVMQDTHPGLQPFGYAGGLSDPTTALVRFGLRDLDTEVGRWTSSDPIGFAGGGTNLYEYVRNSPIQYVDPTGLCSTPDCWDEFLDLTISAAFDLIGARLIGFFARVGRSRILAQSVGQRSVWAAEARNAGDVINANVYDQIADLIGRISREEIELAAQDAIVSSTLKTYEIGAADWANDPFWQNILNLVPYLGTGMKLGDFLRCLGFGLIL